MSKDDFSKYEQVFEEVNQLEEIEQRRRRALTSLLDQELNIKGKIFAQKINMGFFQSKTGSHKLVTSYVTVQKLSYVAQEIKMGSDMPFMQDKIDPKTLKLIIDKDNIQSVMQRAPDWTRQIPLTAYLVSNPNHKFTTILAVIEPNWINDSKSDNWGDDMRAIKSAVDFQPLDSSGSIGLLNIEGATTYALDGQHRIMAIKGVQELQSPGQIWPLTKNGKQKGSKPWTREEFFQAFPTDPSVLGKILDETVSIEYVPAVIAGETREEARRRLRSYFVSINTYAKKVSKGEGSLLDEEDGYKIVAKDLALEHPIFQPNSEVKRINMQDQSIPKTSNWLTTLEAITNMSENFLSQSNSDRMSSWSSKLGGSLKLRPSEEELEIARNEFKLFLDGMHSLPVFQRLDRGETIPKLREFPSSKPETHENEGHLLLRPIGQQILADAVGGLIQEGAEINNIFDIIKKIDEGKQFSAHLPSSIFFGVTVDLSGSKMITFNQDLAKKLLVYLIRGGHTDEQQELVKSVVNKRTVDADTSKWINFDGDMITKEDNYSANILPKPFNLLR